MAPITATYNYGHYLPEALDSILAQTFADWESIIVDDGSTDNTPEVVQPYLKDPRFRYIRTENRGQPAAENTGLTNSQGRFVAFLDADDSWMPAKLERQLPLFSQRGDVGVVYSQKTVIDPHGEVISRPPRRLCRGRILASIFRDNFVTFSSAVVRREVFDRIGMFDERCHHASDYDFWLRVAPYYDFDFVDEPLVKYRTGHANLTSRGETQIRTALRIMDRFLTEHGGRRLLPRSLIRRAYAETYAHIGRAVARRSLLGAQLWFLRALATDPFAAEAWRTMLECNLPRWVKAPMGIALRAARRVTHAAHPG